MNDHDGRSRATAAPDAWANLARAILVQAIKDYKHVKHGVDCWLFFESAWFEDTCDLAGYNPVALREKLQIR